MRSHRYAAFAGVVRPAALLLGCGLLATVVTAGCATGVSAPQTPALMATVGPTPQPASQPPVEVTPAPAIESTLDPPASAPPNASLLPAPPEASLTGAGGGTAPGELGSYTWFGAGSDAPWIVPPPRNVVAQSGPFTVAFEPDLAPVAWTARWAPVVDGVPGDTAGSSSGGAGPILIAGPGGPGAWGLQVDVHFAGGGRAAWYWRLQTSP